MCGKRLKMSVLSLSLLLLSLCSPLSASLYAEVRLTDEEAQELLSEIEQSKTELQTVKKELKESKAESQELKTELEDVKNTYSEQKTYYEEQLSEAEQKNQTLKTCLIVATTASIIFSVLTALMLFL